MKLKIFTFLLGTVMFGHTLVSIFRSDMDGFIAGATGVLVAILFFKEFFK